MDFSDFKKILLKIIPAELLKDDVDLKKSAKMSEDEIVELAESLHRHTPEHYSHKVGRYVGIKSRNGRLVWSVRFAPVDEDGLPSKGGHTIFEFDDKTGELLKEFFSPY